MLRLNGVEYSPKQYGDVAKMFNPADGDRFEKFFDQLSFDGDEDKKLLQVHLLDRVEEWAEQAKQNRITLEVNFAKAVDTAKEAEARKDWETAKRYHLLAFSIYPYVGAISDIAKTYILERAADCAAKEAQQC